MTNVGPLISVDLNELIRDEGGLYLRVPVDADYETEDHHIPSLKRPRLSNHDLPTLRCPTFVDDDSAFDTTMPADAREKQTKGKQKIPIEFIHERSRRLATFSKRKTGMMKRAAELAELTGAEVLLVIASETNHVYTYATKRLRGIIDLDSGKELIKTCLSSSTGEVDKMVLKDYGRDAGAASIGKPHVEEFTLQTNLEEHTPPPSVDEPLTTEIESAYRPILPRPLATTDKATTIDASRGKLPVKSFSIHVSKGEGRSSTITPSNKPSTVPESSPASSTQALPNGTDESMTYSLLSLNQQLLFVPHLTNRLNSVPLYHDPTIPEPVNLVLPSKPDRTTTQSTEPLIPKIIVSPLAKSLLPRK